MGGSRGAARRVWPQVALALWAALVLFALTEPGYRRFGARIEPFVLGLPFSFAWVVGWALATFCVLVAYHRLTGRRG